VSIAQVTSGLPIVVCLQMGTDSHASKCHYRKYIEVHAVMQLFDNSVLKKEQNKNEAIDAYSLFVREL
jgi:hypothetical protein